MGVFYSLKPAFSFYQRHIDIKPVPADLLASGVLTRSESHLDVSCKHFVTVGDYPHRMTKQKNKDNVDADSTEHDFAFAKVGCLVCFRGNGSCSRESIVTSGSAILSPQSRTESVAATSCRTGSGSASKPRVT